MKNNGFLLLVISVGAWKAAAAKLSVKDKKKTHRSLETSLNVLKRVDDDDDDDDDGGGRVGVGVEGTTRSNI
jgi:hypothetical protein